MTPLLPAQRTVQIRVWRQVLAQRLGLEPENLPRRNGAIVEPLHHCAWPRKPIRR